MLARNRNRFIFWATGDVGINPAPIVIEIVVDVSNSELGCRWSRSLAVSDREGEVDIADEIF